MITVITYGTFDLFHIGHLKLLQRLSELGDKLIVGVSTDEFNSEKGKSTIIKFEDRAAIVGALRFVDQVIPEYSWDQKPKDIKNHDATILVMGDDWTGKFDHYSKLCEVQYVPRTYGVSTSSLKDNLGYINKDSVEEMKKALDMLGKIVKKFD